MKPLGMTMFPLQVVKPTPTEDAIWDAVEKAILAGWTPTRFKRECADAWRDALKDRLDAEVKEWAL